MTVKKNYTEVTDKEREILTKKAEHWFQCHPQNGKFMASPALAKEAVMEFIANMNGKTIYEPPLF